MKSVYVSECVPVCCLLLTWVWKYVHTCHREGFSSFTNRVVPLSAFNGSIAPCALCACDTCFTFLLFFMQLQQFV